ncbi:histidine kinase [Vibrio sp. SS-MA-C1-2]|uniref:histidine kinase n=1 Tax=Vibrio sp. SS-MA-C1-2 TaxID=2908646 RepID=UPI001F168F8C|nr:histidine kinase [Vibrio sp. SS-MA-C1-2]UJF18163.1 histidine kinase [Vibrio sp. SS-MA-C1-2]
MFIQNLYRKVHSISMLNTIALSLCVLSACAILSISASIYTTIEIQGNAHAINKIGHMRMKAYEVLTLLPINTPEKETSLLEIDEDLKAQQLTYLFKEKKLQPAFNHIKGLWYRDLKPKFLSAQHADDIRIDVVKFVSRLDVLVERIDRKTEANVSILKTIQTALLVAIFLLLYCVISQLKSRIFDPWRQILVMTEELTNGNYKFRYETQTKNNEITQLGLLLNNMAEDINASQTNLIETIHEKTKKLSYQNQLLDLMFRASGLLISDNSKDYCSLFNPILSELKEITDYEGISIEIFDLNQVAENQLISTNNDSSTFNTEENKIFEWPLNDNLHHYGLFKVAIREEKEVESIEINLLASLVKQITLSLSARHQETLTHSLILAEERTAIARELHDSIAQSLSCLKIGISCMQMHPAMNEPELKEQLKQVRNEVDQAYTQLRHLLTTFRLSLNEPGLFPAIKETINEFNSKLGLNIGLEYKLPADLLSPNQSVHILQIIREALANIHKHAEATEVDLSMTVNPTKDKVTVIISDNGRGMEEVKSIENHHGLKIMTERAQFLPGTIDIQSKVNQGTNILISIDIN